jgi:tetratricopeptide (TPR) repeat protein
VSDFLVGLFGVSDPVTAKGRVITARYILDSGAEKLERELADQPRVKARLMYTIGGVYRELGHFAEAERLLARSLATRERLAAANGAEPIEVVESTTELGRALDDLGRFAEAESTLLRSTRLGARTASDDPRSTEGWSALAALYRGQGRYASADSAARRRIAALERIGAEDDRGALLIELNVLAMNQAEQGRPAAAESLFRQIVDRRERKNRDDPQLGTSLGNLASSLFEQGKLDEAERYYRRAHEIDRRVWGTDHVKVGIDLYNLANLEGARSRHAQAIELYGQAQRIFEKASGPDHPYVAAALTATANAYGAMGRWADAVPLLERSLGIRERTLAPEHPFVATTLHELGETELKLRRYAEAERHLARALAIREKVLEPTSHYTAMSLEVLAALYQATGRDALAETTYHRAIRQWESSGHEEGAAKRDTLGRALAALAARRGGGTPAAGAAKK